MKKKYPISTTNIIHHCIRRFLTLFVLIVVSFIHSNAQAPLDESEIYERIMQRKNQFGYKEGTPWDNSQLYVNKVEYDGYAPGYFRGYGCFGFMLDMMEYASNYEYPIRTVKGRYDDLPEIHIGDGVRINFDEHSVVVIGKNKKGTVITVVEGNFNNSVHWGREIDISNRDSGFRYIATFWPENLTGITEKEANHIRDITVYNLSGILMKSVQQTEIPANAVLKDLPQGTYIVKDGTKTYKVFNKGS